MSPKVSSSPGSIKYTSQESGSEKPIMEKQQGTQAKQMEVKRKKKKKKRTKQNFTGHEHA